MGNTTNYRFPYPEATDPVQVSADMGNMATAIDTRLLFDSSRNKPSLVQAEAFDATQYLVEIVNTNASTQLFSIPITNASVGDLYIFDYGGSVLNQSNATRTMTTSINLGTTTLFTGTSGNITTSAGIRPFSGQIRLYVDTLTANIATSFFILGGGTQFNMNGTTTIYTYSINTSTEDLTTSKNLSMNITLSSAHPEYFMRLQQYRLMRLPG